MSHPTHIFISKDSPLMGVIGGLGKQEKVSGEAKSVFTRFYGEVASLSLAGRIKRMRTMLKVRTIVSCLDEYPRKPATFFEFITHLIFEKKALMPVSYYFGYVFPVFNEEISKRYHEHLEFLIEEARKDGYIRIGTGSMLERQIWITHEGKKFLLWGEFLEAFLTKKQRTIGFFTNTFAALGGISFLVMGYYVYQYGITWIADKVLF